MDYTVKSVRAAAILTGSYVAGTVIENAQEFGQLSLLIQFTKGSLTTAEVKVEFSIDNSTWIQETAQSISGGTATESALVHQYSASGNYLLQIANNFRYIKISANGTGTATSSSMTIDAILASV